MQFTKNLIAEKERKRSKKLCIFNGVQSTYMQWKMSRLIMILLKLSIYPPLLRVIVIGGK